MSTASKGRNSNKKSHVYCRRCGGHSYHPQKGRCASCGYGASSRQRSYAWQKK